VLPEITVLLHSVILTGSRSYLKTTQQSTNY